MRFPDAINAVLKGGTVCRSSWSRGCRVAVVRGRISFRAGHKGSEWAMYWAGSADMLATDWKQIDGSHR